MKSLIGRACLILSCFCLAVVLLAGIGSASTFVSGPVSGRWTTSGSPYVATANLQVLVGQSLEILPGVDVLFLGPYQFIVNGTLDAHGAAGDSITFGPYSGPSSPWCGIRFIHSDAGCVLSVCRLRDTSVEGMAHDAGCGSAIYSDSSSPLVQHCRFSNCQSAMGNYELGYGGGGGGLCGYQTNIVLRDNRFLRCHAHGMGGGINLYGSTAEVSTTQISACSGFHYGGGIASTGGTVVLFDDLIVGNEVPDIGGGGVCIEGGRADMSFCTIADNIGGSMIGGYGGGIVGSGELVVRDCILWGNTATSGSQVYPDGLPLSSCDVQGGYSGPGNFDEDPLFVHQSPTDTRLKYFLSSTLSGQPADSPCIDRADCTAQQAGLDAFSTRTDLYPDEGVADLGFHLGAATSADVAALQPTGAGRLRVSPNPLSGSTVISMSHGFLPRGSIRIIDAAGRAVRTLTIPAGTSRVLWDGRDDAGRHAAPGIYMMRLEGEGRVAAAGRVTVCR